MAERLAGTGELPVLADSAEALMLAWALKDLSFAVWSTEPARAAGVSDAVVALLDAPGAPVLTPAHRLEIQALAHWTRGVTHITCGEMADAVPCLDDAAAVFEGLGQAAHAVQTQVSKIIALAMLGRYEDAGACGERAKREFVAGGDMPAAARVSLNLASMNIQRGEYAEAARLSREAAVLFARVGDHEHSIMADINVAAALTSLGDFDEALRIFARARMRAESRGFPVLEALVDESVALLQLARGRFDEALRGFERARQTYEVLAMPQPLAIAEKQLADVYLELRMLPEAQTLYEGAAAHFEALDVAGQLAGTQAQLGRLYALQGQRVPAVEAFDRAASLYGEQGNPAGEASVGLSFAELELESGRPHIAEKLADLAALAFEGAGLPEGQLRSQAVLAMARLRSGHAASARDLFGATLERARAKQMLSLQVRCLTGLGLAAQAMDDCDLAASSFESAVDLFEAQRRVLPGDDLRHAFLADHLRPYQELLRLALRAHERSPLPAHAARVLQRLDQFRARALAERLASGPEQVTEPRIRSLRERLNRLYREEQKLNDEGDSDELLTQERRRVELDLLEQDRRARLAVHPVADPSVADSGVDLAALCQSLGDSGALIEYGVLDDELFACVATPSGVGVHRHLASWSEVLQALQAARFQLETLSQGKAHMQTHLDSLTRRAQTRLTQLHRLVWAPLAEALVSCRRIVVVPHARLSELPFAALYDGTHYLAQRFELACAPSARLALRHLNLHTRAASSVLAIGDSKRLAHAASEARVVAGLFAQGRICIDEQATIDSLRRHGGASDIVHLACHAKFRSDNPRFSALQLDDGALTVDLVESLPLSGHLVVLSACETGLSASGQGDEMVGLVRAFLVGGSARVVASLWPVDDAVTASFMTSFYTALRGGAGTAAALRQAQIDTLPSHPHPFFWAGFALHGAW
ncbi:MAG: hypothetical protein RL375_3235 [Pseudomonadota bacterium]